MTKPNTKPQPLVDVWNAPFWAGCTDKQLRLPYCLESGRYFFPPAPVSPFTGKASWEWRTASGRGTVWSFVVFHRNYFGGFADELPYPVVMIQLDEGPFLLTNLRGADPSTLKIGQRMRAVFDDDETSLVQFAPEE